MSTLVVERSDRKAPNQLARILHLVAGRSRALFAAWKNRRAVADLLDSDDRMLADIGITRGDVISALSLPADRDPSSRLVVLSVERRAARIAMREEVLEQKKLRAKG